MHNVFLNGEIEEEVYMEQPLGFVNFFIPHFVCKLSKALNGLKQFPKAWFTKLSACLHQWGFVSSMIDASMFILSITSTLIIILVYIEDIIILVSDSSLIQQLISSLDSHFTLKDLRQLSYFFGLEVHYTHSELHLSQTKYIKDLFTCANMLNCKSMSTSMSSGPTLSLCNCQLLDDPTSYKSIVGVLHYCTLNRLEINFSVNKVYQFMHKFSLQPIDKLLNGSYAILRLLILV